MALIVEDCELMQRVSAEGLYVAFPCADGNAHILATVIKEDSSCREPISCERRCSVHSGAGVGVGVQSEAATITVYTDRSLWEANVGTFSTEDFSGIADTGELAGNVEHTFGLLTFSYTGAPEFGRPAVTSNHFVGDDPQQGGGTTYPGPHIFEFPYSVLAWGADFTEASTGALLDITMAGVTIALVDYLPAPGTGFFGIISDTPFNQVSLAAAGGPRFDEIFIMDNVSFGEQAETPVPEPASLLLFGTGALVVSARMRRRKQQ